MFVDTDGGKCVTVSFSFGADPIDREYEIRVIQYEKGNELGGPPGCLQFFIATTAAVISFNWRAGIDTGGTNNLSKIVIKHTNKFKRYNIVMSLELCRIVQWQSLDFVLRQMKLKQIFEIK